MIYLRIYDKRGMNRALQTMNDDVDGCHGGCLGSKMQIIDRQWMNGMEVGVVNDIHH